MTLVQLIVALPLLALVTACDGSTSSSEAAPTSGGGGAPMALTLTVNENGYQPGSLTAPAGQRVRLTITRTADDGCGQQIVFPSLDIRRDLPLNTAVPIEFSMPESGSVDFACGMDMMRGSIVAQ